MMAPGPFIYHSLYGGGTGDRTFELVGMVVLGDTKRAAV